MKFSSKKWWHANGYAMNILTAISATRLPIYFDYIKLLAALPHSTLLYSTIEQVHTYSLNKPSPRHIPPPPPPSRATRAIGHPHLPPASVCVHNRYHPQNYDSHTSVYAIANRVTCIGPSTFPLSLSAAQGQQEKHIE